MEKQKGNQELVSGENGRANNEGEQSNVLRSVFKKIEEGLEKNEIIEIIETIKHIPGTTENILALAKVANSNWEISKILAEKFGKIEGTKENILALTKVVDDDWEGAEILARKFGSIAGIGENVLALGVLFGTSRFSSLVAYALLDRFENIEGTKESILAIGSLENEDAEKRNAERYNASRGDFAKKLATNFGKIEGIRENLLALGSLAVTNPWAYEAVTELARKFEIEVVKENVLASGELAKTSTWVSNFLTEKFEKEEVERIFTKEIWPDNNIPLIDKFFILGAFDLDYSIEGIKKNILLIRDLIKIRPDLAKKLAEKFESIEGARENILLIVELSKTHSDIAVILAEKFESIEVTKENILAIVEAAKIIAWFASLLAKKFEKEEVERIFTKEIWPDNNIPLIDKFFILGAFDLDYSIEGIRENVLAIGEVCKVDSHAASLLTEEFKKEEVERIFTKEIWPDNNIPLIDKFFILGAFDLDYSIEGTRKNILATVELEKTSFGLVLRVLEKIKSIKGTRDNILAIMEAAKNNVGVGLILVKKVESIEGTRDNILLMGVIAKANSELAGKFTKKIESIEVTKENVLAIGEVYKVYPRIAASLTKKLEKEQAKKVFLEIWRDSSIPPIDRFFSSAVLGLIYDFDYSIEGTRENLLIIEKISKTKIGEFVHSSTALGLAERVKDIEINSSNRRIIDGIKDEFVKETLMSKLK